MRKKHTFARTMALVGAVSLTLSSVVTLPLTAGANPGKLSADPGAPAAQMQQYPASAYTDAAGRLPAGLVAAVRRDLDKSGSQYLAEAAAATQAVAVVSSLSGAGVDVLGSRMENTTLVVNVATAADVAPVTAAGGTAVVGAPTVLDLSKVVFHAAQDIYGGQAIVWNASGSTYRCSVGFNGYALPGGATQLATAGHCAAAMANIDGSVMTGTQTLPGSAVLGASTVGLPISGSGQFGGGFDGALVGSAAVATKAAVLTWGGGAGAPLASTPLSVTGVSAAIVNASLCKSGSTTGWSCGTVQSVDRDVSVQDDANITHTVNSIIASTCVEQGDSGGAALIGQSAVGITSSSVSSPACGQSGYFSAFFPMVSAAGKASVASQFTTSWEPQISVSTPVISTSNGGTSSGGGSITGTLANSDSAKSTVNVYLDGSASASATSTVTNGNWNVILPALSSGSHSYQVVASWGSRSTSTPATGSVTSTAASSGSAAPPTSTPIYRFWSPRLQVHFFTANIDERNSIIANYPTSTWTYEGIRFNAFSSAVTGSIPAYRFWSPRLGDHFYTTNAAERDHIIASYDTNTWTYEGIGFYVYPLDTAVPNTMTVARFWSPDHQAHFYTSSQDERNQVIANYPANIWTFEGDVFRVPSS